MTDRALTSVLRLYTAVSALCVLAGTAALLYRALGHSSRIGLLWPSVVIVGGSSTATAGLALLALVHRGALGRP